MKIAVQRSVKRIRYPLVVVALVFRIIPYAAPQDLGMGLDEFPEALYVSASQRQPPGIVVDTDHLPGDGVTSDALPVRVDLSSHVPPIRSQSYIGSCAGWSTVYYAKSMLEHMERGWDLRDEGHQFAPLYTYNQLTRGVNRGTAIVQHMQILVDQGVVTYDLFPYVTDINITPSDRLKERATPYRIESYDTLPRKDGAIDQYAIKTNLAEGRPVVGGFTIYNSFYEYRGGVYQETSGTSLGGHAMTIVGFDDERAAFRIANSWGSGWGDGGFVWLSYDSVDAMTRVSYGFAIMIDEIEGTESLDPPKNLEASKGSNDDKIELSWSRVCGASGYELYRAENETAELKLHATAEESAYTDEPLPPAVTYVYAVKSVRTKEFTTESSGFSPIAVGWTQARDSTPGMVTGLDYVYFERYVVLAWHDIENADGYNIYRYDDVVESFHRIGTSRDAVYIDFDTTRGDLYYTIEAYNSHGRGIASEHLAVVRSPKGRAPGDKWGVRVIDESDIEDGARDDSPIDSFEPFDGEFFKASFYDPDYTMKAFGEFAEAERIAFENWKKDEQQDFEEFKKNEQEEFRSSGD